MRPARVRCRSGEINAQGLDCLQATLQDVFIPVLEGMNDRMWGAAKKVYVDNLVNGMAKFGTQIEKASASMKSGVKLALADPAIIERVEVKDVPGAAVNLEGDDAAADHFNEILVGLSAVWLHNLGIKSGEGDDYVQLFRAEFAVIKVLCWGS